MADRAPHYDLLVVGAGITGAVVAERARAAGWRVLVIERRAEIGGGCQSYDDPETGIHVHRFGAHVFHTNGEDIWRYADRFARFRPYRHRVISRRAGREVPLPIDRAHAEALHDPAPPAAPRAGHPRSFADKAMASVGARLYDEIVAGYTAKQWGISPARLPARLPFKLVVTDKPGDYFSDPWQGLPADGYSAMVARMLEGVEVRTGCDFFADRDGFRALARRIVYTGPLDRWFNYCHGPLRWRQHHFDLVHAAAGQAPAPAVHVQDADIAWFREIDFGLMMPEPPANRTVLLRERLSDCASGDALYLGDPILKPHYAIAANDVQARYRALADAEPGVLFGGRLADYRYYNMDHAIGHALKLSRRLLGEG